MEPKIRLCRRHSKELKAQVVKECAQPGASLAAIALVHGLNANLVHKWRRESVQSVHTDATGAPGGGRFLPLPIIPDRASAGDIRIEMQRGATAINVTWPASAASECAQFTWPASAASECAQWLRELLLAQLHAVAPGSRQAPCDRDRRASDAAGLRRQRLRRPGVCMPQ
jgi:transposase